ncbi:hypothetical protein ACFXAF_16325 [Kitasatospora sp. NPDC059463]|uniref:hypothetical protein n=1 Tax=unclassified Kitasatospora TaxID=2633591 RepID=UPI0036C2A4B1
MTTVPKAARQRMEPPPLCPFCFLQTAYDSPSPTDDTWGCDICGRYGFLLPAEYIRAHPSTDAVVVAGVDRHPVGRAA